MPNESNSYMSHFCVVWMAVMGPVTPAKLSKAVYYSESLLYLKDNSRFQTNERTNTLFMALEKNPEERTGLNYTTKTRTFKGQ